MTFELRLEVFATNRVVSLGVPTFVGQMTNFSRTGLQLETSQLLTPGRVSELRISPAQKRLDSILVEARVAWCRQQEKLDFSAVEEFVQQ